MNDLEKLKKDAGIVNEDRYENPAITKAIRSLYTQYIRAYEGSRDPHARGIEAVNRAVEAAMNELSRH